jgi:polysaccharide export outer membrane protein
MQWQKVLALAVLAIGLSACAAYPPEHYGFNAEPSYTLDSGDEIRVVVFEAETLPQTFKVSASGHISLPVVGAIDVRGKTTRQVERVIAGRLRGHFINAPQVSVQVVAYRPFYVLGQAKHVGQYPFTPGLTVESAVAMAGGYTGRAHLAEARLVRPGPDGSTIVSYVPGGHPIRPGDTIYVPERRF